MFGMGTGVTPPLWSPKRCGRHPDNCTQTNSDFGSSPRPISTGQLNSLRSLHFRPINLVVFQESYSPCGDGKPHLEAGFALRCFQRLSFPDVAIQPCPWRDNWDTSGPSTPVLSY